MNVFFDEYLKMQKEPPVGIPKIPTHVKHPEAVTQIGQTYLWIVFGVMSFGVVAFSVTFARASYRYRVLHGLNLVICAIAAASYFAMASGIGSTIVHSDPHNRSNWREVFYARYIDWAFTTPLLILDLTLLSGTPVIESVGLIIADIFMIGTGLVGALHPSLKYRWGFYGFSCAAFVVLVASLVTSGRSYAFVRHPKVGSLYTQVSVALAVVWTLYPVVWGFAEGRGILSADNEVLAFGILDIIAKPVWGLWIVLAMPAEGHVILSDWLITPGGSVSGGGYGAVAQDASA